MRKTVIQFRCSKSEQEQMKVLADLNCQSVTEFIKMALNEAALDCTDTPIFKISPDDKDDAIV